MHGQPAGICSGGLPRWWLAWEPAWVAAGTSELAQAGAGQGSGCGVLSRSPQGACAWSQRLSPHATLISGAMLLWRAQASSSTTPVCGCATLQPLRLSPLSQHQSSPRVCPLHPEFQHPAPTGTSGCTSQTGGRRVVAQTICVGLSVVCLPQTGCCTLL